MPDDTSIISAIYTSWVSWIRPALEASKDYGNCTDSRKQAFLYGVDLFLGFLKSKFHRFAILRMFPNSDLLEGTKNDITSCTVQFNVNHELFKGFLLAPHQIEATSKRRDKVEEVQKAFYTWVQQIKIIVEHGHQIVKEEPDAGPLVELEHWRHMLTKFNYVVEFTNSRPFQNYMKCLDLSRSKLIVKWKKTEDDLNILLNESLDNVKYLTSIEKFWDPLYRSTPLEIVETISKLLQAVRTVYNSSRFYNTSMRITGFLSKIVNQLIIASQKYLTNRNKISIWQENMKNLVKKLEECKKLKESFHSNYEKVIEDMEEAGEKPFNCSEKYLFERMKSFETRLSKIHEIMEICLRFRILDRVTIAGMEPFAERIKTAFKIISSKSYDPLAHRLEEFDTDYANFQAEVNSVELEMRTFVKRYVEKIESVDMRLVTLKRFDRLNLDCLCLDRRYLDVAVMLEKEIEIIKDSYNEDRGDPPIGRNIPPVIGRIMWSRSLLRKIEDPLNILKARECVIKHPKAQLCVKYYNYIAEILFHYEAMQHKAWFTFASQVRSKLEVPLIRKNPETNYYELNLDQNVLQVVKETESMWKLNLEVPDTAQILAYCKHKVFDAYDMMKLLIARNNKLRRSIYPMFVPLMRVQLIKLERIFSPALSTVTWLTQNLEDYFQKISDVLLPIEGFLKDVSDINDAQIDVLLNTIESSVLIFLPEGAVSAQELMELNEKHRQKMEKKIEMKSLSAEKAAVDLINRFVEKSGIPFQDDSGKFQLPANQITNANWRLEESKPINKYDWLSFEKLYKAVGYATSEENESFCFKEYDGLKYDVTLLHIDCVELFAFYNHKVIAALAKSTKRSMELFKKRSNISGQVLTLTCGAYDEKSLIKMSIELRIPDFILVPTMPEIQKLYDATLLNIIETHYAVTTWGKQAKTEERKLRKPLLDEIKHDRNWFKMMSEHKEVSRYKMSFDNGVMQLDAKIASILKGYFVEFKFLWDEFRDEEIENFVKENPLTANIRDKLLHYDRITDSISKLDKVICVRTIEINCEHMINTLVEESKKWKLILGTKLSLFYRTILDEMVDFIQTQQKVLSRDLVDLDDCRIAMECLKLIRENFLRIDQSLNLMEDTYAMFATFLISIPPEDTERVDGLRYQFNTMIKNGEAVGRKVLNLQVPLQQELEAGVAKFKEDLVTYDDDFVKRGPMVPGIPAKEASDRVVMFESELQELSRRFDVYSSGEKLFGLPVNEYPVLMKRKKDINFLNKLYKLYLDVMRSVNQYSETLFKEIDMTVINAEIQEFVNRCRTLPKGMKDWPAFIDLKKKIDDFNECCPLVEYMSSYAMKERHWTMLETVMSHKFDTHSLKFTLGVVLQAPLLSFKDDIEDICGGAIKEADIDIKLQTVIKEWKEVNIPLATFKNRGELLIKASDVNDIVSKLEDSLMIMGSLASNRFNAPFKKEIMLTLQRLSNTNEIIERWLQVQYLWMYLEAVFVSGDIARQLPMEAKRFSNIDKGWVRIMFKARDTPNVIEICTGDDIVDTTLRFLLDQLEACQKSLTGYLEMKRLIFPRFFFVSDPVLLEILGQASNPASIQPHLQSIFDGTARVEFDEKKPDMVLAMLSSNGERVPLLEPVKCSGNVEVWIGRLMEMVLETVRTILATLGMQISEPKFNWKYQLEVLCGQAQLICIQLLWTKDAEYALSLSKVDKKIVAKKNQEFQDMLDYLVDQTVKDLTKLQRVSCETLVTIHVHQRDIFDELMKTRVKSTQDFDWQKQARFYFDVNLEEVVVKITDIDFIYQNEYLGVTERLAITPLTDRCYITLSQAIGMYMGGAPAGPAGTGKTETTVRKFLDISF